MNNDRENNPEMKEQAAIGENSMVKVGFVLGLATMFGWAVWWASGVQSDLSSIKVTLARFSFVDSLDARVKNLETFGTPITLDLDKRLTALRSEFELHKALTSKSASGSKLAEKDQ